MEGGGWREEGRGGGERGKLRERAELTDVNCRTTCMAVLVCRVTGPVLITDLPLARAMKTINWRRERGRERKREREGGRE